MRFDRNDYSVPVAFALHELIVIGGIDERSRSRSITSSWLLTLAAGTAKQTTFDPVHYLALLERNPGALDFAKPLEDWELPGCFGLLRSRLEALQA